MPDTLLTRLFLDAQDEFTRALAHVPAPGRGGPIGSLNAPGWVAAHVGSTHDAWIHRMAAERPTDEWADAWIARVRSEPDKIYAPPLDEGVEAFARIAERAGAWLQDASWDTLTGEANMTGTPFPGTRRAYLVARAIAHIYIHAGELSVLASLMGAEDMGLPGMLPRSSAPTAEDDPTIPVVAAMLRDGMVEMRRVMDVMPQPAVVGAMDRLNPVSHNVGHLLGREDRLWNVGQAGLAPSEALAALQVTRDPAPLPWEPAQAAYRDVEQRIAPWLDALEAPAAATPMQWRNEPSSVGAQLARSATHFFAHAGESMAHASLYGTRDIGMPGEFANVAAVFTR
jgi:hypothetical protein